MAGFLLSGEMILAPGIACESHVTGNPEKIVGVDDPGADLFFCTKRACERVLCELTFPT